MTEDRRLAGLLGQRLDRLAPIIAQVVRLLDKPGTRALRYKLDGEFHNAVGIYNAMERQGTPGFDYPKGDSVVYDCVIPIRHGGQNRPKAQPRRGGHLALVGGTDLGDTAGGDHAA